MDVVELSLVSGVSVYVNSGKVATLEDASAAHGVEATKINFGENYAVVVKGDIDSVAFKLFPSSIR